VTPYVLCGFYAEVCFVDGRVVLDSGCNPQVALGVNCQKGKKVLIFINIIVYFQVFVDTLFNVVSINIFLLVKVAIVFKLCVNSSTNVTVFFRGCLLDF
jgi:hypothetical protein